MIIRLKKCIVQLWYKVRMSWMTKGRGDRGPCSSTWFVINFCRRWCDCQSRGNIRSRNFPTGIWWHVKTMVYEDNAGQIFHFTAGWRSAGQWSQKVNWSKAITTTFASLQWDYSTAGIIGPEANRNAVTLTPNGQCIHDNDDDAVTHNCMPIINYAKNA